MRAFSSLGRSPQAPGARLPVLLLIGVAYFCCKAAADQKSGREATVQADTNATFSRTASLDHGWAAGRVAASPGARRSPSPASPRYAGGYSPRGVGGGGALSCFSMSPYSNLWLVGTDMGTLYRSPNAGANWVPIAHSQMRMTSDLEFVPPVGFSSDGQTLYFAPCADPSWEEPCVAKRSTDAGRTWAPMDINSGGRTVWDMPELPPDNIRPVRYWACSSTQEGLCYAATVGGLDRTADKGLTWAFVNHDDALAEDSRGSFLDSSATPPVMYHATPSGIFKWADGQPDTLTAVVSSGIRWFAGGRDGGGLTLAYVDMDTDFCGQVLASIEWSSDESREGTLNTCGRLWISIDGGANFIPTQHYTYKVAMAENNGRIIYSHGARAWDRNYGTRVYKTIVGSDGSSSTTKVFDQTDWDNNYALWPADKLEYSAIGLDVG